MTGLVREPPMICALMQKLGFDRIGELVAEQ